MFIYKFDKHKKMYKEFKLFMLILSLLIEKKFLPGKR